MKALFKRIFLKPTAALFSKSVFFYVLLKLIFGVVPVKQKVCRMRPEMLEKINAEVMKQFNIGFLAITSYPQWVANVVLVPKKDGKV